MSSPNNLNQFEVMCHLHAFLEYSATVLIFFGPFALSCLLLPLPLLIQSWFMYVNPSKIQHILPKNRCHSITKMYAIKAGLINIYVIGGLCHSTHATLATKWSTHLQNIQVVNVWMGIAKESLQAQNIIIFMVIDVTKRMPLTILDCGLNLITEVLVTMFVDPKYILDNFGFQWNFKWHNTYIIVGNSYVGIIAVSS